MNLSAAGYESKWQGFFAPEYMSTKIVQAYQSCALTPMLAQSDFFSDDGGELVCGSKVIYGRSTPLTFFSQDADNNEAPENFDGPSIQTSSMTICQSKKFRVKLSDIDKKRMCSRYDIWEEELRRQIDGGIRQYVDAYSIPKIIASASKNNVGKNAGKETHSINLGTQGSGALNANTEAGFKELMYNLQELATEIGMNCASGDTPYDGVGASPVIVIPNQLRRYASEMMRGLDTCCSDKNVLRTGVLGDIFGFKVVASLQLRPSNFGSAGKLAPVLLVDPTQVMHAFEVVTNRWHRGEFEEYLVGQFIFETEVMKPDAVAVAITRI